MHPNGEKYDGEWKDNMKHGKGTYFYASGASYTGDWQDDVMHGKGIYTYVCSLLVSVCQADFQLVCITTKFSCIL